MKRTAPLLLALALATTGLAAAEGVAPFQEQRDAWAAQVNQTAGPVVSARMKPLVYDAQNRIISAVRDVGTHQKAPPAILTFGQKLALRHARRVHAEPEIELTPEQRSDIDAYISAVTIAVAPIVRDTGAKIDLLLMPQQRSAIDALRRSAREAVNALPPAAGLPELADALLDAGFGDAGSFALLVEIDPKAIASGLR